MTLYCQAILPKAGLGNRLFPWARCSVYSLLNGVPMLSPSWAQIKLGPLLRAETDLRLYHNLFRKKGDYVTGLKRRWLQLTADHVPEPDDLSTLPKHTDKTVVDFRGWKDYFRQLNGHSQFLHRSLRSITKAAWLCKVDACDGAFIGLHVRRGDFTATILPDDYRVKGALRTPIEWFVESLETVRRAVGLPVRAVVVSDGRQDELRELLGVENVTWGQTGSAIGDLMLLSKAKILIGSGGSSFSAWASYLGQMPAVAHPGQSLTWFNLQGERDQYIGELDLERPPQEFLRQAEAAFGGGKTATTWARAGLPREGCIGKRA